MANPQLLEYIKQQMQLGVPKEQIKSACTSSGWQMKDIDEAISFALREVTPPVMQVSKKSFSIGKIIGIILGIPTVLLILMIFAPIQSAPSKESRDSKRGAYVKSLQLNILLYADEHQGKYPASLDELYTSTLPDRSKIDPVTKERIYGATLDMGAMPLDPTTKKPYEYQQLDNGKNFKLCVQFESLKEKSCVSDGEKLIEPDFPNRGSGF